MTERETQTERGLCSFFSEHKMLSLTAVKKKKNWSSKSSYKVPRRPSSTFMWQYNSLSPRNTLGSLTRIMTQHESDTLLFSKAAQWMLLIALLSKHVVCEPVTLQKSMGVICLWGSGKTWNSSLHHSGRNKELNSSITLDSWATCIIVRIKFNHEFIPIHDVYIYTLNVNKSH